MTKDCTLKGNIQQALFVAYFLILLYVSIIMNLSDKGCTSWNIFSLREIAGERIRECMVSNNTTRIWIRARHDKTAFMWMGYFWNEAFITSSRGRKIHLWNYDFYVKNLVCCKRTMNIFEKDIWRKSKLVYVAQRQPLYIHVVSG